MKTVIKKVLAVALVLSLCAVLYTENRINIVKADGVTGANVEVLGASIRFINNNSMVDGIRFAVGIKSADFDNLTSAQKMNYHLLIMPTQLVNGELEKGEAYTYVSNSQTKTASAQDISVNWDIAADETRNSVDYKVVRIYLNEINSSYYMIGITARAYYEESSNIQYSNSVERSYYTIADSALEDLEESNQAGYNNSVGSKFSPYNNIQRDALLGVKYEKTGTWDYVDGKLVTEGSKLVGTSLVHPFLLNRTNKSASSNYVINTSFYVGITDDPNFAGTDTSIKGFVFAYDESTGAYYILDFRYRSGSPFTAGWYPYLRYFDGTGWSSTFAGPASTTYPLGGMTDFRISVNAADPAITQVRVECKAPTNDIYTTVIDSSKKTEWTNNSPKLNGNRIGFYTTMADQTLEFDPNVVISDNTVQTRGLSSVKTGQQLAADGTGIITGSFIHDFRTSGMNEKREGIKFSGTDGNGYYFYMGDQPSFTTPRFYIGMWKWNGSDWANTGMLDGAVVPSYAGTGANVLSENAEILVKFEIKIYIGTDSKKHFDTNYTLSCGSWSYSSVYNCKDNGTMFTGSDIYYKSEDVGLETGTASGDGKTTYYPIKVGHFYKQTDTGVNTVLSYADNGSLPLTVKQTASSTQGSEVRVVDLDRKLPNTDNFTVSVDMSPLYMNTRYSQTGQGILIGGHYVVLNSGSIKVYDGSWKTYIYDSAYTEVITNTNPRITMPEGLKYQSNEWKLYTLIVTVRKENLQSKLTVSVKVDGVTTILLGNVDINNLGSTTLEYYGSMAAESRADMTTTFSNTVVTDNSVS